MVIVAWDGLETTDISDGFEVVLRPVPTFANEEITFMPENF